ncbi:MAG TPA: hydrogenase maturation protease [Armatimonadota bacterium]|jgi:hydrogenase maturation protease
MGGIRNPGSGIRSSSESGIRAPVLLLGYGNELRGDDGIGPAVARAVEAWGIPGVEVIEAHQLTPELSDPISKAGLAIFVDAAAEGDSVAVKRVLPDEAAGPTAHAGDPAKLLGLAKLVFGHAPEAWYVTVPAPDMAFREGLSPEAEAGVAEALERIRALIAG